MLPIKNESRDECSGFVSDSIDYIQMKILYLGLAFIIKRSNDQIERTQLVFIVGIISCKLCIL